MHIFIWGGDGDINQSKKIIDENDLRDHVELLGWVKNEKKEEYLKKCSIFILPSYHEGMPMSVLEAMSYGLATISTNVGGIPQIIENRVNGIRIDAGNVAEIKDSLIEMLSDLTVRSEYGKIAYRTIRKKFNAENNIEKMVNIYSHLVDK